VLRCVLQAPWEDFADRMAELGFEKGWGRDVSLVREQFRQLLDILQVGALGEGGLLQLLLLLLMP
jgi:hypothetical protein